MIKKDNCYCIEGHTCYVFRDKIRKAKNCEGFKKRKIEW